MLIGLLAMAMAEEGGVSLSGASSSDYYEIQEGDTLWDISSRFLGNPQAWPELWSVNDYITNPHWIYPGNRIYFRLGDDLNPPATIQPDSPVAQEPLPEGPLCDFPARFNNFRGNERLFSPGIIGSSTDLNARGKVYGSEDASRELGERQFIYLNVKGHQDVECGQTLAIFREVSPKKVKNGRGKLGRIYQEVALVRVFRLDGNIASAELVQSFSEVERGDLVGDPIPVNFRVDTTAPNPDRELDAQIIARLTQEQMLASTGETIFLDRGNNDGLEPGTALYLVQQHEGLESEDVANELLPERVIGRAIVIRSTDNWSAAVVVDAATNINVGMRLTTTPNE